MSVVDISVSKYSEKPESFDGKNFKRWQTKLQFYLTTLKVIHAIESDKSIFVIADNPTDKEIDELVNWEHKDYMCRNYILNCLTLDLYDVYLSCKSTKELWNSLEKKYVTKDARTKKFVVRKFLDFKMNDGRTVVSQVEELQIIIHEIIAEGYKIYEGFQVLAIIEKLPPSWKAYKNGLKHKRKKKPLEDLIIRIKIEEDNRMTERRERPDFDTKANLIKGSFVVKNQLEILQRVKKNFGKILESETRENNL
ncbi:uncharacterized protein LOC111403845 [Olea europaea var. sylvestris]|uniref:uncharacterized protein LOC111403845 n=1 Tax=Olea europaea var. sylvestris TaxID=158386 RepID=UPI000C1CEF11|nr:uncharacterized protein LOC111403845 [Olea europaea var. sylvestris]